MRDPKRIPRILAKVEKIWEKYPDMRLIQLLHWLAETTPPFYFEDELLEKRIDKEQNS